MNFLKISKIVSLNIIFSILFLSCVEFLLGNWRKNFLENNEYIQIPNLVKNKTFKYDVRRLYSSEEPIKVIYKRDKFGYRSRDSISNKPLVLTIGGSTTDERYVTEGETWQDLLDSKLKQYDFINGGVDGQSSFGHLISISRWHSKFLDANNVRKIIFYIGGNDRELENIKSNKWDIAQSRRSYVKNLLKDNSFFASKLILLRKEIEFYLNSRKTNNTFFNYSLREKDFIKIGKKYELYKNLNLQDFPKYKEIFSNLLSETRKYFPKSEIIIVQQQLPGCKFVSKKVVYDRHPNDSTKICLELLKVFNLQEQILSEFPIKNNIELYPMYLREIIKDDEVYDYVHTNNKGSKSIADYIESIITQK